MLTERSLVYNFSACAGKDLEFKQNLIFEFWQKCKLRLITRKTNSQNSRLAQNKILIGVHFFMREAGTDLDLFKLGYDLVLLKKFSVKTCILCNLHFH